MKLNDELFLWTLNVYLKLKKIILGEKVTTSKVIVFVPQIQFKPVYGKSHTGIEGHSIDINNAQKESLQKENL